MKSIIGADAETMILRQLIKEVEAQRPDREAPPSTFSARRIDPKDPYRLRVSIGPEPAPNGIREYVSHVRTGLLNADGQPIYRVQRTTIGRHVEETS